MARYRRIRSRHDLVCMQLRVDLLCDTILTRSIRSGDYLSYIPRYAVGWAHSVCV